MNPTLKQAVANDVRLAYWEHGSPQASRPSLFMVHATGFHGRLWDYLIEQLDPQQHVIAVDQRGHGHSESVPLTDWRQAGQDLAELVPQLDGTRWVGVGHSMGAHALIDCAALTGAFDRLLLLDPTVAAPEAYAAQAEPYWGDGLHPAAKRRDGFASVEEMMERLAGKSSFPFFHSRIFEDYCRYGLEPAGEGLRLRCRPVVEAAVYMTARTNGRIYESVAGLDVPVKVVRAQTPKGDGVMDWASSPTWPGLAGEFPNAVDVHWDDCTHFIPMQRPHEVVALIRAELDASV